MVRAPWLLLVACGGGATPGGPDAAITPIGQPVTGQYNLGPVSWSVDATHPWTNSCATYPAPIQSLEGTFLAGTDNLYNGNGALCDACLQVTTGRGKTVIARIVTTGVSNATGDLDLSDDAYAAISANEYPRAMTWQIVSCPNNGPLYYQWQTGANVYWTSLWVRNPRLPVSKLEVQSANHATWFALTRGPDGTFTDSSGFGAGAFMLRITAADGQVIVESYPSFTPGGLVASAQQFR